MAVGEIRPDFRTIEVIGDPAKMRCCHGNRPCKIRMGNVKGRKGRGQMAKDRVGAAVMHAVMRGHRPIAPAVEAKPHLGHARAGQGCQHLVGGCHKGADREFGSHGGELGGGQASRGQQRRGIGGVEKRTDAVDLERFGTEVARLIKCHGCAIAGAARAGQADGQGDVPGRIGHSFP